MKTSNQLRTGLLAITVVAVTALASCGGGGASVTTPIIANTGGVGSPYAWMDVQMGKTKAPVADPNASVKWQGQSGANFSYMGANAAGLAPGVSTDSRTQSEVDASLKQTTVGIVVAPLLVPAAGAAAAYGGAALYGMGVTAQSVPLAGGIGAVSAGKWVASTGVGFAMGAGLEYGINADASPASMVVGGIGGAVGGTTKLGLNAAFGLANQWVPSTLANIGTWLAGSQVAGSAAKGTLNQVVDTEANGNPPDFHLA